MMTHLNKKFALLFLLLVTTLTNYAQNLKEVVKKMNQAIENLEHYEIAFRRTTKTPSDRDSQIENYTSRVFRQEQNYIGWHIISGQKSKTVRTLFACNGTLIGRLQYHDSLYFVYDMNDKNRNNNILRPHLFHPFTITGKTHESYNMNSKGDDYAIIETLDTIRDGKKRVRSVSRTVLTIDKKTWLPVKEEIFSTMGQDQQYSRTELVSINILKAASIDKVKFSTDSFIRKIKTYKNGDSIKQSRKVVFQPTKVGDTAKAFKATIQQTSLDFDLSQYKDSIVILDFFYTGCAPCVAALPEIRKFVDANKGRGIAFFGVDGIESDWKNLEGYIKYHEVNYQMLKASKLVLSLYSVTNYPRMVIIHKGIIVKVIYGYSKGLDKVLTDEVNKLLGQ